jgi:hypothetical protein
MRISIGAYVWGGKMKTCLVWSSGLVQAVEYIASQYYLDVHCRSVNRRRNYGGVHSRTEDVVCNLRHRQQIVALTS